MRFDILTIFPEFFAGPLDHGVVARARQSGRLQIAIHDLRGWAPSPHRITDDRPFGGGEGMVMKPEPIHAALTQLLARAPSPQPEASGVRVCLLSAQGQAFRQADARRFAGLERLILICGRYEGVDERVAAHMVDEEIAIGDFVLSGGELAAAVVLDATARLLPGVLGDALSAVNESFSAPAQLDCPHYTRPVEFQGWVVPEVLRQGDHAAIARWRRREALRKTRALRPDLFAQVQLSAQDRELLDET
ncbi:MAG: tRNA (guanosine(37)-N1)-methyltransferase TrmD [Terriglobales bacterium]